MRISDWSSDVCSSDLHRSAAVDLGIQIEGVHLLPGRMLRRDVQRAEIVPVVLDVRAFGYREAHRAQDRDRKSVGSGKSVSVRVDLGVRGITTKKKTNTYLPRHNL